MMYEKLALWFNDLNIGSNVLSLLRLVLMLNVIVNILVEDIVYSVIKPFPLILLFSNWHYMELKTLYCNRPRDGSRVVRNGFKVENASVRFKCLSGGACFDHLP